MMFTARVEPSNLIFFIKSGETILEAALKQGFDFSYGCQQGACGTCVTKLVEGEVTYPEIEPLGLEEDEADENFILLCGAVPQSNIVLHHAGVTAPWDIPIKTLPYRVTKMRPLSHLVVQLFLTPATDNALTFRAGQYIEIVAKNGEKRPFSIANAPSADHTIELHVRHTPDNTFSTDLLNAVANQEEIELNGPHGKCIYRQGLGCPLIFIAGGTGFTHSKAIIEQVIQSAANTSIHLFWGAKTPDDLYMNSLPQRWQEELPAFRYTPTISQPDGSINWQGQTTSLPQLLSYYYPELAETLVYASGPPQLVQETLAETRKNGLKREFFFSDLFDFM